MQNSEPTVKYKPALIFKSCEKLKEVYKATLAVMESKTSFSGSDILSEMKDCCSKSESEALLLNFVDRGMVERESGAYDFKNFKFANANPKLLRDDLKSQLEAAEIISLATPKPLPESKDCFDIAVTYPTKDENFNRKQSVPLIYSHVQRMFSEAKKSIFIVNPFFDEDGAKKILETLIAAAEAGVKIKLIVREANSSQRMKNSIKIINDAFQEKKLSDSMEMRDYYKKTSDGQLYATHAKIIVIDNKECYTGSANITFPSFYYNFELGCIIKGSKVKVVVELLNELWECSEKVKNG